MQVQEREGKDSPNEKRLNLILTTEIRREKEGRTKAVSNNFIDERAETKANDQNDVLCLHTKQKNGQTNQHALRQKET